MDFFDQTNFDILKKIEFIIDNINLLFELIKNNILDCISDSYIREYFTKKLEYVHKEKIKQLENLLNLNNCRK